MSRRLAALVAVFSAVVLVGISMLVLGRTEHVLRPIHRQPSTVPLPSLPVPTATEPHPHSVVTPGAFCDREGANGATKDGTPMRCTRKPGEDRATWRSDG